MARAVFEGRLSKADAGRAFGVTPKVVVRWTARYAALGRAGMIDRPSRPARIPRMTLPATAERIVALRRQRFTGRHIAREVGVSPATVSRVLRPGDMIHIDIKKLGRFERVGHRITGDRTGQSDS